MSYNETLQSNNLDLQDILSTINALPSAGGGASNIAYGTFTIDAKVATNTISFEHGLGCTPDLVVVFTTTNQSTTANKGTIVMVFDALALRRYAPSSHNAWSAAILEEADLSSWADDTTFTLAYAYWYYGVGDHVWVAIKRGAT